MITIKKGTIKSGILKGEKYKIIELSDEEQVGHNFCNFIVTLGEHDDIDFETFSLEKALDFVMR